MTDEIPIEGIPVEFEGNHSKSSDLVHKIIFSPSYNEYYYTVSDRGFSKFDIYEVKRVDDNWSVPVLASFNSEYDDHGMSFSPDGASIYFSSTRPTNIEGVTETWHIWKSERKEGKWETPTFIDILNMRDKLVSHPVFTNSGTIYFHTSNLDYSEMDIYCAQLVNGSLKMPKRSQFL